MSGRTPPTRLRGPRPRAATAVGLLALLGIIGSAVMALAHFGLEIPLVSDLGPGRMLLPVAVGFTIGACLYAVVAYGAFAARTWAWPVGVVVNGLAFVSAAFPYRGWVSGGAMVVAGAALAVLVGPARAAFLGPRPG